MQWLADRANMATTFYDNFLPSPSCVVVSDIMSTAKEVEAAILALPQTEREKLVADLPALLPELGGDAKWSHIIHVLHANTHFPLYCIVTWKQAHCVSKWLTKL